MVVPGLLVLLDEAPILERREQMMGRALVEPEPPGEVDQREALVPREELDDAECLVDRADTDAGRRVLLVSIGIGSQSRFHIMKYDFTTALLGQHSGLHKACQLGITSGVPGRLLGDPVK